MEVISGTVLKARLNRMGRSEESADREHAFIIHSVKEDGSANDIPVETRDYTGNTIKGTLVQRKAIQDGG